MNVNASMWWIHCDENDVLQDACLFSTNEKSVVVQSIPYGRTEYRIQITILYSVFCFTTWFDLTLNLITDITSKNRTTHTWTTIPIQCSAFRTYRTGILSILPCSWRYDQFDSSWESTEDSIPFCSTSFHLNKIHIFKERSSKDIHIITTAE